jgi:hypothetical protein
MDLTDQSLSPQFQHQYKSRRLYTVDDRTGIVFEVADKDPGEKKKEKKEEHELQEPVVVPRWIIMEGDGL